MSYQIWGAKGIDDNTIEQMNQAAILPVSVAGALMPDAHLGYGLPIGGVLACDNAVIPYAVGVDIACRMKLSVLPIPTYVRRRCHKQTCSPFSVLLLGRRQSCWRAAGLGRRIYIVPCRKSGSNPLSVSSRC